MVGSFQLEWKVLNIRIKRVRNLRVRYALLWLLAQHLAVTQDRTLYARFAFLFLYGLGYHPALPVLVVCIFEKQNGIKVRALFALVQALLINFGYIYFKCYYFAHGFLI